MYLYLFINFSCLKQLYFYIAQGLHFNNCELNYVFFIYHYGGLQWAVHVLCFIKNSHAIKNAIILHRGMMIFIF